VHPRRRFQGGRRIEEPDSPDQHHEPDRRRGALIGLLVVLLLVIGGLALAHVLRNMSRLQDCAMSGRTNCVPISPDQ
jgi:hypothetical protein